MQVKLSLVMVLFLFLACSSVLALDLDGLVLFLGFDESSGDTAASCRARTRSRWRMTPGRAKGTNVWSI